MSSRVSAHSLASANGRKPMCTNNQRYKSAQTVSMHFLSGLNNICLLKGLYS